MHASCWNEWLNEFVLCLFLTVGLTCTTIIQLFRPSSTFHHGGGVGKL